MFHHIFRAKNCLIQCITIEGHTITFYHNKSPDLECPEFARLKSSFHLKTIQAESKQHFFLHNEHSNDFNGQFTHVHYSFEGDPQAMLRNIVEFLIGYQDNSQARNNDRIVFEAELDQIKERDADHEHPQFIKDILDNFDCRTPFIPKDEVDELLASFEKYQEPENPMHLLNVVNDLILKFLDNGQSVAILDGDSVDGQSARTYFNELTRIRNLLLQYDVCKDENLLTQAKTAYNEMASLSFEFPKTKARQTSLSFFRALNPISNNSGIIYCLAGRWPCQGKEMLDFTVGQNIRNALNRDQNFLSGLYATFNILVGDHYDLSVKGRYDNLGGAKGVLDFLILPLLARKLIADTYLDERSDSTLTNVLAWSIAVPMEILRFSVGIALTLLLSPVVALVHLYKTYFPIEEMIERDDLYGPSVSI